eukprot:scaffold858_cov123-Cylindrotheca_fusiformis.AAC.23
MICRYFSFLLVLVVNQFTRAASSSRPSSASTNLLIRVINTSGSQVGVWWINPNKSENDVKLGEIADHTGTNYNTFRGHTFQLREQPRDDTGACASQDQTCRMASFVVRDGEDQSYSLNDKFQVEYTDLSQPNAELLDSPDVVSYCKEKAKQGLEDELADREVVLERFNSCLTRGLTYKIREAEEGVEFISQLRDSIASKMENFTCAMPDLDSSPDIDSYDWTSEKDEVVRPVHVKLDRPAARIHVIENFARPEECMAVEKDAHPKLHRASTADGKGGSTLSLARKAMQAGIHPQWDKEEEGDLVARVSRRVYDYTNFALGLNISEAGQEPIMSIQYAGRGINDTEPDRYTSHCDGKCEGKPHMIGGRMATMVIYCEIPESGGHTNFKNAGVHVRPSVGSAIFFGYIDPEEKIMDSGFTTHSGCPVYVGEKKIITQWVRLGVTAEMHSETFNTLGVLKSEAGED